MPADHKVSVAWQIVATFIPIANFWAFYRIRKLRKYLLYAYVPALVISTAVAVYFYYTLGELGDNGSTFDGPTYRPFALDPVLYIFNIATSVAFQGLAVYLAIRWSREYNRRYDRPASQT
jgi:formate hydrogenlyase subunit 3/multisubunit Na+/H+ antiporter MnhD subunit